MKVRLILLWLACRVLSRSALHKLLEYIAFLFFYLRGLSNENKSLFAYHDTNMFFLKFSNKLLNFKDIFGKNQKFFAFNKIVNLDYFRYDQWKHCCENLTLESRIFRICEMIIWYCFLKKSALFKRLFAYHFDWILTPSPFLM